jgi:hypothetical protein
LEQVKSGGVPECVRRNSAFAERRTVPRGEAHGASEPEVYADSGERVPVAVGEERLVRLELMGSAPLLDKPASLRPKRHRPIFSSLAVQVDQLAVGIGDAQLQNLRDPCAGIVHEREKRPVALAAPSRVVASGEDGGHFLAGHEADERLGAAFEWDGEKPLAEREMIGSGVGENKVNEAANRSQSRVARSDRIAALGLEMLEKGAHGLGREGVKSQFINWAAQVIGDESKEQTEGISVSGDGLRADVALVDQVVRKIPLNER